MVKDITLFVLGVATGVGIASVVLKKKYEEILEEEIASLYVPFDKSKTICKVKHLSNREVYLPNIDAAREFVLKCIEEVCGNCIYHEEGVRKSFNI